MHECFPIAILNGTCFFRQCNHGVDSVRETSLREIIGRKFFALINLSLNFCETTIYDKVFVENLVGALTLYEIIKDFLKFCSC